MTFRDDHDATRARADALEREIAHERDRSETARTSRAEVVRDHEQLRARLAARESETDRRRVQMALNAVIAFMIILGIATLAILYRK